MNFQNISDRMSSEEAKILAAIRKEPQSANELSMVLNMGKYTMQRHIRKLLGAGIIEREKAISNYGGRPHPVRTGRYQAIVRADSHDLECTEPQAVSA